MTDSRRTIVLTGAAGNLGSKLREHWRERHRLRLVDFNPRGDDTILCAELTADENRWSSIFAGADVVVHLAGNPNPLQSWEDAQRNIQVCHNVFALARKAQVRRVVYASSNHIMGGYKDEPHPWTLTTSLPPLPGTIRRGNGKSGSSLYYALGKLYGEELSRCYAALHEMIVIAVRIGWVQRGENTPDDMPDDIDAWTRLMWLSNADLCHLFDCCLTAAPESRFLVVNGMSANRGMRWDIDSARHSIGYCPRDGIG